MSRSKPIHPDLLSMARRGDIAGIETIKLIILATPRSVTAEVVDVLFENMTMCPVPPLSDLKRETLKMYKGTLTAIPPALCISLFWSIVTTKACMKPGVKTAVVANILEHDGAFCRWIQFSMRSGLPSLPGEELGNSFGTNQKRFPLQAQLLIKLLALDESLCEALLSSDPFIDLFLELWCGEASRNENGIMRVIDLSTEHECPIISLAHTFVQTDASLEVFLSRCSGKTLRQEFLQCLLDRVIRGDTGSNIHTMGWALSLLKLVELADRLWTSSSAYRQAFHKTLFLPHFCRAWRTVTSFFAQDLEGCAKIRFMLCLPTMIRMLSMAIADPARHLHKNWRILGGGGFLESFFQSIFTLEDRVWDAVWPGVIQNLATLLAYPALVHPTCFGDITIIEVKISSPMNVAYWNVFARAWSRAKAASEALVERPPENVCDNPSCDGTAATPKAQLKQCGGCSSVIYCSVRCQEVDWQNWHQKECPHAARVYIDRQHKGMTYDSRTRGSHAALLEVAYAEEARHQYADHSVLPLFSFGWLTDDSGGAHDHLLSSVETYWGRHGTSPASFPQEYLRPRYESLVAEYVAGNYPSGWRLVEGNFPPYGDEKAIYVTALLKPAGSGYRTICCIARFKY
ncbi:hypothetical protein FA13DRAFT_1776560 [Coprinellus micaceus]|uniref:MYND-type domain-containing protein n=1 Tax=Coprinellus micaceus TaxID=71717 RepID=A0A4Y7SZ70_COPMI|nr:hypothetical protein FA13DRAFT_1776560 [Coprinellus micaceus]